MVRSDPSHPKTYRCISRCFFEKMKTTCQAHVNIILTEAKTSNILIATYDNDMRVLKTYNQQPRLKPIVIS